MYAWWTKTDEKSQERRFPKCQSQASKSLLLFINGSLELWLFSAEPPAEWHLVDSHGLFCICKANTRWSWFALDILLCILLKYEFKGQHKSGTASRNNSCHRQKSPFTKWASVQRRCSTTSSKTNSVRLSSLRHCWWRVSTASERREIMLSRGGFGVPSAAGLSVWKEMAAVIKEQKGQRK